jgi:hypothetical protein
MLAHEFHEVVLHELRRGRHRVEYGSETLIEASDDATLDACRVLLARGLTGTLRTRNAGATHF